MSISLTRRFIFCTCIIVSSLPVFFFYAKTPIVHFSHYGLDQRGISSRAIGNNCSSILPCTIWMLWDQGWSKAPPMQTVCLKSWQFQNPNYEVKALDLPNAEVYINRSQFYSNDAWTKAIIQAKSDIIRIELLARYGGIWADATVFCNEPLNNWLDKTLLPEEFVVYERHDSAVTEAKKPWISSWFIASTSGSRLLTMWVDEVRKAWSKQPYPPSVFGYFWIHRIFARLVKDNAVFRDHFEKVVPLDAGGPHCLNNSGPAPHVYKLKVCPAQKDQLIKDFTRKNDTDWVPVIR